VKTCIVCALMMTILLLPPALTRAQDDTGFRTDNPELSVRLLFSVVLTTIVPTWEETRRIDSELSANELLAGAYSEYSYEASDIGSNPDRETYIVDCGYSLASALDLIDKLQGTEFSEATVRAALQQPAIVTVESEPRLRYYTDYRSWARRSRGSEIPVDCVYNVYASFADMGFGSPLVAADDLLCLEEHQVDAELFTTTLGGQWIKTGSFDRHAEADAQVGMLQGIGIQCPFITMAVRDESGTDISAEQERLLKTYARLLAEYNEYYHHDLEYAYDYLEQAELDSRTAERAHLLLLDQGFDDGEQASRFAAALAEDGTPSYAVYPVFDSYHIVFGVCPTYDEAAVAIDGIDLAGRLQVHIEILEFNPSQVTGSKEYDF
jgi:hypothetical protein